MVPGAPRDASWSVIQRVLDPQERSCVRPLTGYRRKPWGLGVHAPARGLGHKWRTHTLPPSEAEGSPRNHSSPRDPLYQWEGSWPLSGSRMSSITEPAPAPAIRRMRRSPGTGLFRI